MLVTAFVSKLRAYIRYRASLRTLSALSDRQLNDIGVARGNIEGVARHLTFR